MDSIAHLGVLEARAGFEEGREGVVIRAMAVDEHPTVDLKGVDEVIAEKEGLDHGVVDADCGPLDVVEEEEGVGQG